MIKAQRHPQTYMQTFNDVIDLDNNYTSLHLSCTFKNTIKITQILVNNGADVTIKDKGMHTYT
jgi:hypothetical protein